MKSSDDGEVTLKNLVKFKKSGYYRIFVEDKDWEESYIQFNVGSSSSSSDSDLKLSVSDSSVDTWDWVKLTINTDEDYVWKITFTKLQYRSSTSSSWSSVSRTSSTYVSNYTSEWGDWYYKMKSSDDGEKVFNKFIKFKKKWYYRIYAEDTDNNESYVQINVNASSSSSDDIELSTNRKSPSTSQYVNLTIETDDDYTGKLTFSAKWTSISNLTSSTYFSDYSDDWDNWYYKMKSSDDGKVTLKNLVKFKKKWYYRIYVKDTNKNENYIQFNVWSNSSSTDDEDSKVEWFTNHELSNLKEVYSLWEHMVAQVSRQYPYLGRDTYWKKISDNFYDDMKDVINDKRSRDFEDYEDFIKAFKDWYQYTMTNI